MSSDVVPAVKAITCPNCGGSVAMRAAGHTVSLVCTYCGSTLDVAQPEVKLISAMHEAAAELELPLGSHGVLRGIECEIVGYMRRSAAGETWEEYLLFNPYHGYCWLMADDTGWTLGTMLTTDPHYEPDRGLLVGNDRFSASSTATTAVVDYVLGEFYWRVAVGETVTMETYEGRDATLSCERQADESNWAVITPLKTEEVATFAGIESSAMAAAPDEKTYMFGHVTEFMVLGVVASFLMLCVVFVFHNPSQPNWKNFTVTPDGATQTLTVNQITLTRNSEPVTIHSYSDGFENMWIDLDYSLINRQTQQRVDVSGTVEHYTGRDSDGAWSEGSYHNEVTVAAVPKGTYDVVVEAAAHRWSAKGVPPPSDPNSFATSDLTVQVAATTGAVFWSNFWLALTCVLAPPLLFWYFSRSRKS